MINKNFNKRRFAHVHLLNVTMSRCHDVMFDLSRCQSQGLKSYTGADAFHGLKECLPRVMEGISL